MDEVRDWGIDALHTAIEGLTCASAVHICYGYGIKANVDWKATLGGEWRLTTGRFRPSRRAGSTRCRSNAATPRCPWIS